MMFMLLLMIMITMIIIMMVQPNLNFWGCSGLIRMLLPSTLHAPESRGIYPRNNWDNVPATELSRLWSSLTDDIDMVYSDMLSHICSDIWHCYGILCHICWQVIWCVCIYIYRISWPSIWHLIWHEQNYLFTHSIWDLFWHSDSDKFIWH